MTEQSFTAEQLEQAARAILIDHTSLCIKLHTRIRKNPIRS